ncbi:MAG: hypothetical protein QXV69_02840 [Sulfolobaceae archaeon]
MNDLQAVYIATIIAIFLGGIALSLFELKSKNMEKRKGGKKVGRA